MITYENFTVPNSYWNYVLEQKRVSFINEYYKSHKNYPSEEILQNVVLTTEEKEKYKRVFYAQYCVTGIIPSEPNTPSEPIIPPMDGNENDDYVICTYNIASSGGTKLYRYRTKQETYIEKIIYNGEEIIPYSEATSTLVTESRFACYDFGKLGDVTVKYKLKEGKTSMDYVWFGDTRLIEIVIPSCITIIQSDFEYGNIFSFDKYSPTYLNKITSLNKIAPILKKPIFSGAGGDNGLFQRGILYVPKGCAINYTSWMGNGVSDFYLTRQGWLIKELDY